MFVDGFDFEFGGYELDFDEIVWLLGFGKGWGRNVLFTWVFRCIIDFGFVCNEGCAVFGVCRCLLPFIVGQLCCLFVRL